jgi:N-methylhydantoinase B
MTTKITDVHVAQGQRVRLETPGGGGWGNPARRDGEASAADLRLGYVTAAALAADDVRSGDA